MRYSIFEYSQEKLVSLKLDVVDALLLNWFANFFCGNMEKKIFKDAEGNSKIYGWVKISKIIEDLPVLGITSEKGIRLRFDSFVEKGILDRETLNTQKGKKSYYRTTAVYESLINTVALEKSQEKKENNITKSSQRNCTTFAEESTEEKEENISQESFFTFAKNNDEKSLEESSQRNCTTFAERNEITFAQGNCSSFALNNSVINDSLNKDSSATDTTDTNKTFKTKSEEADFLIKKINELFNNQVNFSADLSHKLVSSLEKANIPTDEYLNYILWAFDYLKPRCKLENFPGYFYKSVTESSLVYKFKIFLDEKKQKIEQEERQKMAESVICPICGTEHSMYIRCPECSNDFFDLQKMKPQELEKRKSIYKLPKDVKTNYEAEIEKIYTKYSNLLIALTNPEERKKIDFLVAQIDKKYGILNEIAL